MNLYNKKREKYIVTIKQKILMNLSNKKERNIFYNKTKDFNEPL